MSERVTMMGATTYIYYSLYLLDYPTILFDWYTSILIFLEGPILSKMLCTLLGDNFLYPINVRISKPSYPFNKTEHRSGIHTLH